MMKKMFLFYQKIQIVNANGRFHGTCDPFTLTFTKSFETFRDCTIVISKTFLPLDKIYTTLCWRAVAQIPNTLLNDSLKCLFLCNPYSFALLYTRKMLIIDSDFSSSGLSESVCFKNKFSSFKADRSLDTNCISGYCWIFQTLKLY